MDSTITGQANQETQQLFRPFKNQVLKSFESYQIPVIALEKSTSREAVCVVFEKVNTGGKPLDAFELVTAMYAASGHELRKDWYGEEEQQGRHRRLSEMYRPHDADTGILAGVSNTDFLQVISLFHTRDLRRAAEAEGKQGKDLPWVVSNRHSLLNLPLEAYKKYEMQVERGFELAAKFLYELHVYRVQDLPYQSQIVPLAAILADIGSAWEHAITREKLIRWYWNGVFGELYRTTLEFRVARDFLEVPEWLKGGPEPSTIRDSIFRADRLKTMRTRLSAAYKGVNILLMREGAKDFRSGQKFDHTVFFGEIVDIHHIFPQDWCKKQGISPKVYDSIINKTPLTYQTNRSIGGNAPSAYLARLEKGTSVTPSIPRETLDGHLISHLIDPRLLWEDQFSEFMEDRQKRLLALIEQATGKRVYTEAAPEEGEDMDEETD